MDKQKLNISAFFPAYNEAANLEKLTRKTVETLQQLANQWEVIIVDDGSSDHTAEVAAKLEKEFPGVRYIRHQKNQGYGGAVKTGLREAKLDWIFFTDGDGQFDTSEIALLLPATQAADFVAGYRLKRQDGFLRSLNAFAWGTLVRTLFGLHGKVRDIDCAFKLFQRRVVDGDEIQAKGAMISTELLARAKKMGYTFREVGVHHYPRIAGTQTGANIKVILRAFGELFRLYGKLK
ncbi:glycosyltransferase family 2 protein [bacterium]|nr:glycosyltransferase family 2 protein [bacterium]